MLLIHRLALRKYWPEMYPRAGREDEDRYEAQQTRLMRAARENREAVDAAWQAAWDAEHAKPRRQRQYFSFGEFADFLARDPRTLALDDGLRIRILSDLADWVLHQQFDLASGEVATLTGDPPSFEPFEPPPLGTIITAPEGLMLRREAGRRYIEANPKLENAADLLRQCAGGETIADAMTIIETAKFAGLDPEAYLADVLGRINDHIVTRLHELLPWHWKPLSQHRHAA
jgi:hypothetical protein